LAIVTFDCDLQALGRPNRNMRSGDSAISGAHATSIKDRVGLFEAADPQHSPTTKRQRRSVF
jgi:hypothetical protein